MAGLCMIVNVTESENKQIPHVSRPNKKQKKNPKHVQCIINNKRRNGIHVNSSFLKQRQGFKNIRKCFSQRGGDGDNVFVWVGGGMEYKMYQYIDAM